MAGVEVTIGRGVDVGPSTAEMSARYAEGAYADEGARGSGGAAGTGTVGGRALYALISLAHFWDGSAGGSPERCVIAMWSPNSSQKLALV